MKLAKNRQGDQSVGAALQSHFNIADSADGSISSAAKLPSIEHAVHSGSIMKGPAT
jgi:hypothetical protein